MGNDKNSFVREVAEKKYEYGFTTDVQTEVIDKGLSEDVVRLISEKKGEPDWLLEFRLKAFRHWLTMESPTWGHLKMPEINYQDISYYANPTTGKSGSSGEIDPELMKTFDKLGIPLEERLALSGTAVDAVMDSVSVKTTFRETSRNAAQGDLEVDFVVVRDGEVTAIEVKSGRRGMNSGLPEFVEAFHPKRSFVVGTGGVSLEDFLNSEVGEII